ncbi:MAG: hypothetical protein IJF61_01375 [Clostridia bacterium]|nr:hypothetical protein [Clostridia bacterium]
MKKLVALPMLIIILIVSSLTGYCGSIPEDLLTNTEAKLYVGVVESTSTKDSPSAPYQRTIAMAVRPVKNIKGRVETGKTLTYKSLDMAPLKDETEYVIADFGANNVYAYEIKSRTDDSILLTDASRFDMVQRLEENINNGVYSQPKETHQAVVPVSYENEGESLLNYYFPVIIGLVILITLCLLTMGIYIVRKK